ncbi:MAG: hypothetical protein F8N39_15100 [Clostridiaceae bacterium]|nr:hypothetical protein [Clostridiaceae bacterium]
MPIVIVLIMVGALVGVQSASATTSRVSICNSNSDEVSSFNSTSNDECLEIYARLYVDGEWRALRTMEFYVYGPNGEVLFHIQRLTSFITGYTGIGIWNYDLSRWKTGDYTVKVIYPGNEGKGWPETSTQAVIHHTNFEE